MKNIFRLSIWFLLLLPVSANAQKYAFEVFTNYVLDFPYDIFLNGQESQLIDILRKKNNYEIGLGYNYHLYAGIQSGIDLSYGNKDLNFTNTNYLRQTDYRISNIYIKENSFRIGLKLSYQVSVIRGTISYGLSLNDLDFKSGTIHENYHYLRAPIDLTKNNLSHTKNQYYTLQLQYMPKLSEKIHLGVGLKYLHNFEQHILKDIFVIQHHYFLINMGLLLNI